MTTIGCNPELQKIRGSRANNIICRIPGLMAEEILVTAHYDRIGSGQGAADNWSGVSIMLGLAEAYLQEPPLHSLTFIAFGEEETGLLGSRTFVDNLSKTDRAQIRAFLNLDSLGVGSLSVGHDSTAQLVCLAKASSPADRPPRVTNIRAMSGDWEPFKRISIPIIYFHSLDGVNIQWLHSYRDRKPLVDADALKHAGEVVSRTLSGIDHGIDLTIRVR